LELTLFPSTRLDPNLVMTQRELISIFWLALSCTPIFGQPVTSNSIQLTSGSKSGTFNYSFRGQVEFSQEPAFPTTVSIKRNHEIVQISKSIPDSSPFDLTAELEPGTYVIRSDLPKDKERSYWGSFGPSFTISPTGALTATNHRTVLSHLKMMSGLTPNLLEIIQDKRPILRWEALKDATRYTIFWSISTDPNKADHKTGQAETTATSWTFPEDIAPAAHYEWSVNAYSADRKPIGYYSAAYFLTPGADPKFKTRYSSEEVPHVWLGIMPDSLSWATPGAGIGISGVFPNSPASRAGLQDQDEILQINQTSLADMSHSGFINLIRSFQPGTELRIKIKREGQEKFIKATLEIAPTEK
jgi:hypothetical protein